LRLGLGLCPHAGPRVNDRATGLVYKLSPNFTLGSGGLPSARRLTVAQLYANFGQMPSNGELTVAQPYNFIAAAGR
jgi:hypothetical protein